MFTARYELSSYMTQIRFLFKGLAKNKANIIFAFTVSLLCFYTSVLLSKSLCLLSLTSSVNSIHWAGNVHLTDNVRIVFPCNCQDGHSTCHRFVKS